MPTKNYYLKIIKDNDRQYNMMNFLKRIIEQSTPINIADCPNSTFYVVKGKIIFELVRYQSDKYRDKFYVNVDKVWSVCYNDFDANYDEVVDMISQAADKYLNLQIHPTAGLVTNWLDKETKIKKYRTT